ncbi:oxidoreductase [Streptomyces sp. TRM43335]|uniref:Oxidoreductase n=1 Tax=Streptomyces taklimakanensis TaxID=2569853 RepID=A0A6G2B749_9ACTN|nr:PmoA family protein [Streptomyces taklimakanensis]MTE17903.1 oxidoreductase [Streptomyces taklimakanensis]
MSAPITVTHAHGERISVACGGTELMSYVYRPDPDPFESRKPYAHPLRTLAGHTVTGYRPSDHRWHKGLQMTASHLSGQNFWGGNSYVHGRGYLPLHDRVGRMRHDAFDTVEAFGDRASFTERLTWIENGGREWARETRTVEAHSAEPEEGAWALDWSIRLLNTHTETLRFGSPTTAGREMAGYTGLHWRGPRDLTGGDVFGPDGRGGRGEAGAAEMMGTRAPWLAFTAPRDGVDAHSTLVFAHAPENDDAIHPSHWFVRSEPTPVVAVSWAFFEEFELPPGEEFSYRYRVVVADGAWDRDRVEEWLGAHGW